MTFQSELTFGPWQAGMFTPGGGGQPYRTILGVGAAWSPATLFAAGEQGVWLSRTSSGLFQEPLSGIAATATDDPVGRINDLSGNALPAVQEASNGRRPLLKTTGLQFDGSDDVLSSRLGSTITPTGGFVVPDLTDSDAGKGFTNTGLALDTSDDTLWVGNDGRSNSSDTTHRPSLVNITKAGAFIDEIDLSSTFPSATTIQGVAYDATDDTLWFCSTGENLVRQITKAGASVNSFAVTGANGLAIDTSDNTLLVLNASGISKYTKAGALSSSYSIADSGDQLFFDAATSILYYSKDASSLSYSTVNAFHVPTKQLLRRWILPDAEHIEGILFDDGVLYVCNDAYYHGGLGVNEILTYPLSPISYSQTAVVTVALAFSIPSAPSGTRCALSVQQGLARAGIALCAIGSSTTGLRIFANSSDGTSQRSFTDFTSLPALTTMRVVVFEVDTTAETARLWLDGTQYGGTRSLPNLAGGVSMGLISLGGVGPSAAEALACTVHSAFAIGRALTADERTDLTEFLQAAIA